jgi:hypothetical protein
VLDLDEKNAREYAPVLPFGRTDDGSFATVCFPQQVFHYSSMAWENILTGPGQAAPY